MKNKSEFKQYNEGGELEMGKIDRQLAQKERLCTLEKIRYMTCCTGLSGIELRRKYLNAKKS